MLELVGVIISEVESRPAEHGGGDVGETTSGISPTAVFVLVVDQPVNTFADFFLILEEAAGAVVEAEGDDAGGGGESAAGEPPFPPAMFITLIQ